MHRLIPWLLCSISLQTSVLANEIVGTVDWVKPATTSERGERGAIVLQGAAYVEYLDKVTTDQTGAVDVSFDNKSILFVGPECGTILDDRFYKPGDPIPTEINVHVYTWAHCTLTADTAVADEGAIIALTTGRGITVRVVDSRAAFRIGGTEEFKRVQEFVRDPEYKEGDNKHSAQYLMIIMEGGPGWIEVITDTGEIIYLEREGFYVIIDPWGRLIGPRRLTPELGDWLLGPRPDGLTREVNWRGEFIIDPVDREIDIERPTLPPVNCIGDRCTFDVIDEEDIGGSEDDDFVPEDQDDTDDVGDIVLPILSRANQ